MIAVLAAGALGIDDLDALGQAAAACDRAVVGRAWEAEQKRHGDFVLAALREQLAIVDARAALAERRRAARAVGPLEGIAALTADGAELDDRQRLLDDRRRLDTMRRDAVVYFRQQYISQCNGRER